MTEAASDTLSKPCSACAHFVLDGTHPLHPHLCNRLRDQGGQRLLSAKAERSLDGIHCGPDGQFFTSTMDGPNP